MLIAEQINKQYKHPVLRGVSMTAEAGEVIGIAGENGSGKSTLLSILTTIIKPDKGHVTIEGEDIFEHSTALKRWVGYVPQDNSLFDNLTALDNIKLWASAYGVAWRDALANLPADTADKAFLKKKIRQLSGGMKKRLSIALSLLHQPKYLIMDEPSASLDIGFKWQLSEMIAEMKIRGSAVIMTTHQPDELLLCDRIYVLRGGVFVFEGDPRLLNNDGDFAGELYGLIRGTDFPYDRADGRNAVKAVF